MNLHHPTTTITTTTTTTATTHKGVQPTDAELIMVLGGQDGCWGCFVPDCYIFNFTDPSTICTCPDYPINIAYATGGIVNGEVMVCGGYGGDCIQAKSLWRSPAVRCL